MGLTKTSGFQSDTLQLADVLKALGHPARLTIVQLLAENPNCAGADFTEKLPLAQPTISRHLAELKKAGLIKGNISGTRICYCLNKEVWDEIKDFVHHIIKSAGASAASC